MSNIAAALVSGLFCVSNIIEGNGIGGAVFLLISVGFVAVHFHLQADNDD